MTFQNYSTTVPTLSDILPIIVQTSMTKFNIGDKVKVINTLYTGIVQQIVIEQNKERYLLDDNFYYNPDFLELYEDIIKTLSIGDKVNVIGTKYVGTVVDIEGGKCVVHFDNIGTDFSYSADVLELCANDIENNSNTIPTVESTNTKITVGKMKELLNKMDNQIELSFDNLSIHFG